MSLDEQGLKDLEENASRQNGKTLPNTRMEPAAYTRREQRYLAGASPLVGWRAWPVTGGGSCSLPLGRQAFLGI